MGVIVVVAIVVGAGLWVFQSLRRLPGDAVAGSRELARDLVERLYLTRIHAEVKGDTYFPEIDLDEWELVSEEHHDADSLNAYPYSFEVYEPSSDKEHS